MGGQQRQKTGKAMQERRQGETGAVATDLPGLPGGQEQDGKPGPTARFRRRRRANSSGFLSVQRSFLHRHGLPPAVIISAGVLCYLMQMGPLAAMAFMTLAGLGAWAMQARIAAGCADMTAMRTRFEELEDKAWELSESEERYRAITDAFGDLVVIRDHHNNVLSCNATYAAAFGLTADEVVADNVLPRLCNEAASGKAGAAAPECARPGTAAWLSLAGSQTELAIETSDGRKTYHWLDLPVRGAETGQSAILSVARDITSFRRSTELDAEARLQAEQANRAKSRFLAMASHEMRTPLNGIIGMSKLLAGTHLTPEQENYTIALERSGQSLLHLIEGMLDLTTIEAGRFVLKPQWFDLHAMLEDTLELLHATAAAKGIGLGLYVAPDVPGRIEADGERMRQVLINLVGNAIKFTEKGGVAVECELASCDASNTLLLRVRDTGPGLSEENRNRIFSEFERVDDENTRRAGGAGLGLAISRALADRFGGSLELEDTGPGGSAFVFSVPLPAAQETSRLRSLEGRSIALSVANSVEYRCLARALEDKGATVQRKSAGFEGCDTVLVDCEMAQLLLDGLRQDGCTQAPRVCVLLSAGQKALWSDLKRSGADAWLTRPVRQASLETVLGDGAPSKTGSAEALPAEAGESLEPSDAPTPAASCRRRILLAEDNDINALLVTAALSKAGHDVVRVHNGGEAVELCVSRSAGNSGFDLVLMDMHMPVMDGIEAIGKIRQQDVVTPIFVLSADGAAENRAAALAAGATGCLSKPIDPADLLAIAAGNSATGDAGSSQASM